ncbi:MAG: hypothetical protein FWH38_05775 [Treponema sp.]|nr:hypothetical protein [Treponema sp.]
MKKLYAAIVAAALLFLVLSCAGVDPAKKYPNMVADADPISAGTIEAEFDRLFSSKLNKLTIETIFYPRYNAVCLEFRHELIRYRQYWDENNRISFAQALERYKADYDARTLIDRYRKTRAAYGKVKGRAEWETFKFSQTHLVFPVIEIGYRFRGETPFFATLMRSTKEENSMNGDSSNLSESQQINMYFTRAQAEDLVKLFDQAYLMGLLNNIGSQPQYLPPDTDTYKEYGDEQF